MIAISLEPQVLVGGDLGCLSNLKIMDICSRRSSIYWNEVNCELRRGHSSLAPASLRLQTEPSERSRRPIPAFLHCVRGTSNSKRSVWMIVAAILMTLTPRNLSTRLLGAVSGNHACQSSSFEVAVRGRKPTGGPVPISAPFQAIRRCAILDPFRSIKLCTCTKSLPRTNIAI
jgi:hypothetical protein